MPCTSPLPCFRGDLNPKTGKLSNIVLPRTEVNLSRFDLRVPCGYCRSCRLRRTSVWALRMMYEMQSYRHNCFITLTYNDAHLPMAGSVPTLCQNDFQLFMKRLRKHMPDSKIKVFYAGEYGDRFGRPHYHAILFNCLFPDLRFDRLSPTGFPLYRSQFLEDRWSIDGRSIGFSSVGEANFQTAGYTARYLMKKQYGENAVKKYFDFDPVTGEFFSQKVSEFSCQSKGIALDWYNKFGAAAVKRGYVVKSGLKLAVPRYFDTKFELYSPEEFEIVKAKRMEESKLRAADNSEERLRVKAEIVERQASQLLRTLE